MQKYFLFPPPPLQPSCPQGARSRLSPGRPRAWHGLVHAARCTALQPPCSPSPLGLGVLAGVWEGAAAGGGARIRATRASLHPPPRAPARPRGVSGSGAAAPGSMVGARKVSEKRPRGVESCRASLRFPPALTSRRSHARHPHASTLRPARGGRHSLRPPRPNPPPPGYPRHSLHPQNAPPRAAQGAGVPLARLLPEPGVHPSCTHHAPSSPAPCTRPSPRSPRALCASPCSPFAHPPPPPPPPPHPLNTPRALCTLLPSLHQLLHPLHPALQLSRRRRGALQPPVLPQCRGAWCQRGGDVVHHVGPPPHTEHC